MTRLLLAAAVTPLTDDGERLDEAAFAPLTRYLRDGGVDGVFCCGTTGEGVLLTLDERRRAAELFREACDGIADRPRGGADHARHGCSWHATPVSWGQTVSA